jgi:phosphate transport system substrate-binding protein
MRFKLIGFLVWVTLLAVACGGQTQQPVEEAAPTTEAVATEAAEEPTTEEMAEEPTVAAEEPTTGATGEMPLPDPLAVTGDVVTAGSSTVFPLTERMAERYQNEGYADQITIDSIGTGAGFERFCVAGETDIANASRAIDEDEVAACEATGRTPLEFRVGTDALAVVVNPANDFATDLTLEQLALAFSTAETWADVDPSFPDESIARYSPGTDSGTFDYFVEAIFDEDSAPILAAGNIQFSEDDNVLVQGVEGDPYAIGYFGYAYYLENADLLKLVNVEGVEPTAASAESGDYPLSRPLYIYSDATIMQEKSQVADFINFYLTFANEEIIDVGYFPASEEALDAARQTWLSAIGQ